MNLNVNYHSKHDAAVKIEVRMFDGIFALDHSYPVLVFGDLTIFPSPEQLAELHARLEEYLAKPATASVMAVQGEAKAGQLPVIDFRHDRLYRTAAVLNRDDPFGGG